MLRRGTVIPAHPLALDERRKFDSRRQRALSRYYLDAGSGGLAVGVHATQFQIRDVGLYGPVLELAVEEGRRDRKGRSLIAGLRQDAQASEACRARPGYQPVCWSSARQGRRRGRAYRALPRCPRRSGSSALPADRGRRHPSAGPSGPLAAIENVVAIKVAPFNRYATLDVAFGVVAAGAEERITLYTGNDDHILPTFAAPFAIPREARTSVRIRGGLLGH